MFARQTVKGISPFTSHFSRKRTAFTLAEVLITLGIIGVVAALTMPVLIQNHKEKQTVVKLKKVYSILSQAFTQIREEEGGVELSADTFDNSAIVLMNRLGKHLKFAKVCPNGNEGCFDQNMMYKSITGEDYATYGNVNSTTGDPYPRPNAILADGTTIIFNIRNALTDGAFAQIYVDLNGSAKGPNKLGDDFFYFFMIKDRIIPAGTPQCGETICSPESFNNLCMRNIGNACAGWVIFNENMDYLHCPDKLGWDKAKSCK